VAELVRSFAGRPLVRVHKFGLPGPVWTLMLVQVVAIALLIVGLIFPAHPDHNPTLKASAALVGVVMLAVLAVLRGKTPDWVLWVELIIHIAIAAVLVSASPTDAGAVSLLVGLIATGVYAGFWGSRRMAVIVVIYIVAAGTLGLVAGGDLSPALASAWVTIAVLGVVVVAVIQILVGALEQQSLIDPLTGVMNRRGLYALTQVRRASGAPLAYRSIALIDVDDFKNINDERGHADGDRVLRDLADHWVAGLRSDDLVVRLGGDEFALVFSRVEPDAADELLARLAEGSPAPWSYGVAAWPDGADFDECLAKADMALLEAKRRRREAAQSPGDRDRRRR
jgi:diguanylate cyclase (GGDEF)-like protein